MKDRFSISLDEDSIKAISSLSYQTGLSKSYIVQRWIQEGLKKDNRLSSSERYFWSKKVILDCIENLFNAIGYASKNNEIHNSVLTLYAIPKQCFNSEKEYNLFRVSIFELIDKIQIHDIKLHESIIDSLKEFLRNGTDKNAISLSYNDDFARLTDSDSEGLKRLENSESSLLPASGAGMFIDKRVDSSGGNE